MLETSVRIILLYGVGYAMEALMSAMDRKEIGKLIKICSTVICLFWALGLISDIAITVGEFFGPLIESINKLADALDKLQFWRK